MHVVAQQTRHIYTMLDQYWPNVVDGGPISMKHWVGVSGSLGEPPHEHYQGDPPLVTDISATNITLK